MTTEDFGPTIELTDEERLAVAIFGPDILKKPEPTYICSRCLEECECTFSSVGRISCCHAAMVEVLS